MSSKLKVTLVKSMIGRPSKHRDVLKGMRLTKLNKTIVIDDNSSNRGMINKVIHLLSVEESVNEA